MNTPPVLQIDDLRFGYPQQPALFAGWSACIAPGVTLVQGGEGRGKTTLMRLLAGVLPTRDGRLRANGVDLHDQPAAYRQQVFWAEPRSDAFDQITPLAYLESLRPVYPQLGGFGPRTLPDLIGGLSLAEHQHKPMYMLSTGSKRKVWLAAAFASGAAITLLDDPFSALDKASIAFVLALLQEAASHPTRAWVVAGYEAPGDVPLAGILSLGD